MEPKNYFVSYHTLFPVFSEEEVKSVAEKLSELLEKDEWFFLELEKLSETEINEHISSQSETQFMPSNNLLGLVEERVLNLYTLKELQKGLRSMVQQNIDTLNGKKAIPIDGATPDMNLIDAEENARNNYEQEIKRNISIWTNRITELKNS